MNSIKGDHTMAYEIKKELWYICKICKISIQKISKIYGGANIYYPQVFIKHLQNDHGLSIDNYLENYCKVNIPYCPCGICNKKLIVLNRGANFRWSKYKCGRNEGVIKWSEKAKQCRKGKNNPHYGIPAWNKNLTKSNSKILLEISKKLKGRKIPLEQKLKMSESAKNRTDLRNTGFKHSEETKKILRLNTLRMIKDGKFKHTKSKPHIEFSNILKSSNIEFEEEKFIKYWSFDFYLPLYNLYIEVDGDYFHSNPVIYKDGPKTKTQKINWFRDKKKNQYCIENNIKILRFWESDILSNPKLIQDKLCKLKK